MHPTASRTPRYTRFLLTGGVAGLLLALLVAVVRGDRVERPELLFFYLGLVLAGLGALLGAVVAVVLEARRRGPSDRSP